MIFFITAGFIILLLLVIGLIFSIANFIMNKYHDLDPALIVYSTTFGVIIIILLILGVLETFKII